MRNITRVLMLMIMVAMTGCGSSKDQGTSQQSSADSTVVIWHWMTDKQPFFEKVAAEYQQKTGDKVRFELYGPSDAYTQKVQAASQAGTLPDVYGILAENHVVASFVKAGHVLKLDDYYNAEDGKWRNQLYEKAITHNQFVEKNEYGVEPGLYGIPLDLMTIQLIYNKNLFKKAGLDPEQPPKTWPEFITAVKALKAARVEPFVCGFSELWMIDCMSSSMAINIMGEAKMVDTFRGNVPYTDPDWLKLLSLFKELADAGFFMKGITNFSNKEAEQIFANERAAIALNGSWCVNVYNEMNPNLSYGVFSIPRIVETNPLPMWGSAGASLLINARSRHKEEAVFFLKWLTEYEQQIRYSKETKNIPANKAAVRDLSPVLQQFAGAIETSTHPSRWGMMEKPTVIESFDKGIQLIIIGEKTPEEIAKQAQQVKEQRGDSATK